MIGHQDSEGLVPRRMAAKPCFDHGREGLRPDQKKQMSGGRMAGKGRTSVVDKYNL